MEVDWIKVNVHLSARLIVDVVGLRLTTIVGFVFVVKVRNHNGQILKSGAQSFGQLWRICSMFQQIILFSVLCMLK